MTTETIAKRIQSIDQYSHRGFYQAAAHMENELVWEVLRSIDDGMMDYPMQAIALLVNMHESQGR